MSEEAGRGLEQEGSGSSFFGKKRREKEKRKGEQRESRERRKTGGRRRQSEANDRGEAESFQELQTDAQKAGWGMGKEKNATGQRI